MHPSEFSLRIAQTVEALREIKGVKQFTVAKALNIDQSSYSRRAIGNIPFTLVEIKVISDLLKVSIIQILFIAMSDYVLEGNMQPLPRILKRFSDSISQSNCKDHFTCKELDELMEMLKVRVF